MQSRRNFLKHLSFIGATALAANHFPLSAFAADAFPVVATSYGKIRGMNAGGILTFRGIRYGASTAGPNRFLPPQKPESFSGTYDAFAYGPAAQLPGNPSDPYTQAVSWDAHVKSGVSEDCLFLNVWTPALNDNGNRPVFFYIHGGGFTNGSGGLTFDGDPLARLGNAVVITVNHRLGVFGYCDLGQASGGNPKFAQSSSAGMLDLVLALQWVKENIANFGGNPNNITIFGQSGGGSKVSTLMVMPSAKGLFHKAAVQSGSTLTLAARDRNAEAATALLAEFKIDRNKPEDLQNVPWTDLLQAQANRNFSPVVDGIIIPRNPFDPDAPELSAEIPMIIGYLREDASNRNLQPLTEEALASAVQRQYADRADAILAAYKKAYPAATPFQIQSRISTDANTRHRAVTQATRKAAQNKAPAFLYECDFVSPAFEGRFGATHGTDLGLLMGTARDGIAGNTADARALAKTMGSALVAFAKSGNPSTDQLPWPAYNATTRSTMIFDTTCKVENDPTKDLRQLWERT